MIPNANARLAVVAPYADTLEPAPRTRSVDVTNRVVLSDLERRPLALLHDDANEMLALTVSTATSLVSAERTAARIELLAKLIAAEHARIQSLTAFLDERILCKDIEGVRMMDRALTNAAKRLCMYTREHTSSCIGRRDVVVAINHADAVRVGTAEE